MRETFSVLGVIPVRWGSTRLPGKPLARIHGRLLIELVWERVKGAKRLDRLVVATDDARIAEAVRHFDGEVVMTPSDLRSGTDRCWEAARATDAGIIVNIQGDEPLTTPPMVDRLVEALEDDPQAEMATLRFAQRGPAGYTDPNVVKVVSDAQGYALCFSRAGVPHFRVGPGTWYKHIGLYAYRRGTLQRFVRWPTSPLETAEGLEQMRALENGVKIRVVDSPADTVGVDTPEDLRRVEEILKEHA